MKMGDKDALGDRMKLYEMTEAGRRLMPLLAVLARIDGRGFSGFTRRLERPYDKRLSDLMIETTRWLVEQTVACMGYTQSDEISLTWYADNMASQIFFDGRIQKMVSQLAALATVKFNSLLPTFLPAEYAKKLPTFDARVWNVPNLVEGANVFLWREQDATKNSISMAARAHFSQKSLMKKNSAEMQEMLWQKGVNWNDYPAFFKRGTFVQRRSVRRPFKAEEMDKLPPLHEARKNPDLVIERSEVPILDMPPFGKVVNRPEVIYFGEEPREVKETTEIGSRIECD
jgi:tRNA(His) 5'-end guanylyltransferase